MQRIQRLFTALQSAIRAEGPIKSREIVNKAPGPAQISRYTRGHLAAITPNEGTYRDATRRLAAGEVIGLPTETVYGLAGDATNPVALRRIFELKRRPLDHPLIVHLGDASWLSEYVARLPETARRLAEKFWPGPLTLILERSLRIPLEATGGLETVAVRVPAHPVALRLLSAFGRPLAAPSANPFGQISPTRADHVVKDFGAKLPMVLDGGPCEIGVESTILDVRAEPRLLRPGGLSRADIEAFLGAGLAVGPDAAAPIRAPGALASHYAPRATLELITLSEFEARIRILARPRTRIGIFAPGLGRAGLDALGSFRAQHREEEGVREYRGELLPPKGPPLEAILLTTLETPSDVARSLFAALRSLDDAGCEMIWAVMPDGGTLGEAVDDRLQRAAAPRS